VGNNPVNFVDPLGLSRIPAGGYHESFNTGSCASCSSGLSTPYPFPGAGNRVDYYLGVNGTASCDLSKPSCSDMDIKINNKNCTAVCTREHEEQHNKDIKECCDKGREAWDDVAQKQIGIYQGRGLGPKTLQKKIANIDRDRHVQAGRAQVARTWAGFVRQSTPWAECRAHAVSAACADRLWDEYNCDCPLPKDKRCCKDIERYKKNAEKQRDRFCKKKGADKEPECPF
jgi:hypothetical protein